MLDTSIFTAPAEHIDRAMLRRFLDEQATERLFVESTTLEFKGSIHRSNVVEAICALANTDGGLVLVGVDETRPERAPGVPPDTLDRLMNQCRMTLQPVFCPEVIPVPADDPDRVVLLVRVAADRSNQPVFCGGTVFVRVPGSTVRANRDQILTMARAQIAYSNAGFAGAVEALAGVYYPQAATGAPNEPPPPDLRFRAVGAMYLRAEVQQRIVLGSSLRRALSAAVDDSDLLRWATGHEPHQATRWDPEVSRQHAWRQMRVLPRRWEPRPVTASIEARVEGNRLSWCVDIDITDEEYRQRRQESQPAAIMGPRRMVRGLLEAVRLVGSAIPAVATDQLGSPPIASPQAVLWIMPAQRELRWAVKLTGLPHEVEDRALSEAQLMLEQDEIAEPELAVLDWLQRLLLDDGVNDAEAVAAAILDEATAGAVDDPWMP